MEVKNWIERGDRKLDEWGAFGSTEIQEGDVLVIDRPNQPLEYWEFIRKVPYKSLKVGGVYGESYHRYNTGYDVFIFDGFSDVTPKYGEGGPMFQNIKEVQDKYGVRNMDDIENIEKLLDMKYGHGIYLCTTSLTMGMSGCYYYVSEGRWSRGSGAEPLTFWEVERV